MSACPSLSDSVGLITAFQVSSNLGMSAASSITTKSTPIPRMLSGLSAERIIICEPFTNVKVNSLTFTFFNQLRSRKNASKSSYMICLPIRYDGAM